MLTVATEMLKMVALFTITLIPLYLIFYSALAARIPKTIKLDK